MELSFWESRSHCLGLFRHIYLPTHVHSCQQREAFKLSFFLCANNLLKANKTNKIFFREGNVVERLKVKLINLLRENHSSFFYESKKNNLKYQT